MSLNRIGVCANAYAHAVADEVLEEMKFIVPLALSHIHFVYAIHLCTRADGGLHGARYRQNIVICIASIMMSIFFIILPTYIVNSSHSK